MTKIEKSVEPKSRYLWIDILKGIGIVCVILGHTFIYGDRVYYFHMPLFFIVGGFLFRNGQEWLYLFWKSTKRIIFPFIIYLIVLYFLSSYPPSKWCMLWGGEIFERDFWRCLVLSCVLLFTVTLMVYTTKQIHQMSDCNASIYSVLYNARLSKTSCTSNTCCAHGTMLHDNRNIV